MGDSFVTFVTENKGNFSFSWPWLPIFVCFYNFSGWSKNWITYSIQAYLWNIKIFSSSRIKAMWRSVTFVTSEKAVFLLCMIIYAKFCEVWWLFISFFIQKVKNIFTIIIPFPKVSGYQGFRLVTFFVALRCVTFVTFWGVAFRDVCDM